MNCGRSIAGFAILAALAAAPAWSHGGGLDSCGGHNDRKHGGYHVHNQPAYCRCNPAASGCAAKAEPAKPAAPAAKAAAAVPSPAPAASPGAPARTRAVVMHVVDGDTIWVEIDGKAEKVRLIGIDAPESVAPGTPVQPFAKDSSQFVASQLDGKVVFLEADPMDDDRDKYGRLLRYVVLPDGTDFNAYLISEGYARAYTDYPFTRAQTYRRLEQQPRAEARGLWGASGTAAQPAATAPPPKTATVQCAAITKAGTRCKRAAKPGSTFCWQHGG